MAKKDIKEYICRPFCSFYRDGVKEELLCGGAGVLEKLVLCGKLRVAELPVDRNAFFSLDARDSILETAVCSSCDFRRDDCDFQAEPGPPDAEPCGGYILLRLLAEEGVVSLDCLTESDDE
jgi:hypothetical protein